MLGQDANSHTFSHIFEWRDKQISAKFTIFEMICLLSMIFPADIRAKMCRPHFIQSLRGHSNPFVAEFFHFIFETFLLKTFQIKRSIKLYFFHFILASLDPIRLNECYFYIAHILVYDVLMDSSKDWVYGIYCVEMSHPLNPQKYTHLYSWSSSLSFPEYPLHIYAHTHNFVKWFKRHWRQTESMISVAMVVLMLFCAIFNIDLAYMPFIKSVHIETIQWPHSTTPHKNL